MKQTFYKVSVLCFLGLGAMTFAQKGKVGINTEAADATLDVRPNTANAESTATTNEGILAPRLTKARIANIATPVEGTLVYATDATYTGANTKVAKITEKGYYFYNGTEWVKTAGVGNSIYTSDGTINGPRIIQATDIVLFNFDKAKAANGRTYFVVEHGDIEVDRGNIHINGGDIIVSNGEVAASALSSQTSVLAKENLVSENLKGTGDRVVLANANGVLKTGKLDASSLGDMGATNGQVLKYNGTTWAPAADNDTTYTAGQAINITSNKISVKSPINTVTTAYTLAATDDNGYVYVNSATPVNVTVPNGLPAGFSCVIVQLGTGQLTVVGEIGQTIQTARGSKTRTQHSAIGVIKRTADTATITGDAVN